MGAVVIDGECVLLVRRGQEPLMGEWSLPGGVVELGESLEEAIVREVAEETGLAVRPERVLKSLDRIERDAAGRVRFHYVLIDFLCSVAPVAESDSAHTERLWPLRGASDVSDARWAPVEDLRRSEEFSVAGWTLAVIDEGWRLARSARENT